ncbi:CDC48 family AAA ATPase [Candidatus Woesearchaeota archaeon]|nr:CDC48 family AAA ATPase [Candidatus Woesearchaeota archaeon]MBT4835303.1 CDC48 family AAA ATPase [Candidatus Woesearchaeota archaeon]MBT6735001.1 CDC48 family AAA ATPase [Candidatus Woesearchaeota archaeon]MBT7169908.1 CDC48 family AAA ATPase [Candidatus Woesearchaeota archaeon]MBT7474718.1 CDC48 family AAA ATPase [Candidatus Woesearchaeota archaeon]
MAKNTEVNLKVMEAMQEEAYKGIVRIDSTQMKEIGIHAGDIVEIEGARKTVGIVDRAYPADIGQSIIRMDGILRRNAKTGIGEQIKVRKTEYKEAKKITIAPAQKGVMIQIQGNPEGIKRSLLGRAVVKGDILSLGGATRRSKTFRSSGSPFEDIFEQFGEMLGGAQGGFMGSIGALKFVVADSNPTGPVIITENTQLKISSKAIEIADEAPIPDVTYEDLGGLADEITKIREMVETPMKHPELFQALGIEPPKGVLLHGAPGTGKTLLAKAVANESEANFMLINGPEIMNKFYGESEKKIRQIFEEAAEKSPSIIFIDEIDAIASKREDTHGEVERRVVAQLLTMLDGLNTRGNVVVIGATNRPNSLDEALRRPGRFDREIIFGVPDQKGRLEILKIHTRNMPLGKDIDLKEIARLTHGFVGADIQSLAKEAAMNVLKRNLPSLKIKEKEKIPQEFLGKLRITDKDFKDALKLVRPSAMREVLVEKPNVTWDDIGGLEKLKQELKEVVEWPLNHAEAFERIGIKAPKGVLLYGPPGTGKTMLAKAVANESEANFISIKGPELISKWVGESEKGIRKIFEKARQASPTIIFFDEIDAIAGARGSGGGSKSTERMVNQLLTEMDGLEELNDVVIIAATNRPDLVDPALLRPGRFDRIIMAQVPDQKARERILKVHTENMKIAKDVNILEIAKKTEFYTGSDLNSITREAAMIALREDINVKEVKKEHFDKALKKVRASVTEKDLEKYKQIEENFLRTARGAAIKEMSYMG